MYQEGEPDAVARYKQATMNLLYFNNRQWITWVKSEKAFKDIPNPDDEPRVTLNYIEPILHARVARLVSGQLSWRIVPDSNSYEARDKSQVGRQWITARWSAQEMEYKLSRSFLLAFCSGAVAFKSFWNKSLGKPYPATKYFDVPPSGGEPIFDDQGQHVGNHPVEQHPPVQAYVDQNGQPVQDPSQAFMLRPGDTDTAIRTIFNVRLNPEAQGWTQSEGLRWLIDSEVVPLSTAKTIFPQLADVISALETGESSLTYERIVQGVVKNATFTSSNPFTGRQSAGGRLDELAVIREYWELPDGLLFPKGRLIVTVGGQVAYDGDFPEGQFPYSPLFDEPGAMTPYGRPCVNTMLSPQDVINEQWTEIQKEAKADGTGRWIGWQVPGMPDQMSAKSNRITQIPMRTALAGRSINDVIKRLEPGMVSPDRWKLIDMAKMALFDVGAYHEVTRGQIPPGLDSGVAIQHLLESEAGQLKGSVDALKRTLITWARQQLTIAVKNYGNDVSRWIPVDRPDLDFMVESVMGADLPDPETVDIDLENFRPQSEAAMRAEIKELMGLSGGVPVIDARKGLQLMDIGRGVDGAFDSQTRHYACARRENMAFEEGKVLAGPPDPNTGLPAMVSAEDGSPLLLPEDDVHDIHIDVHHELALDKTKPWQLRQGVLLHIAAHRAAAQIQAQQAAAQSIQAQGALAHATDTKTPTSTK